MMAPCMRARNSLMAELFQVAMVNRGEQWIRLMVPRRGIAQIP